MAAVCAKMVSERQRRNSNIRQQARGREKSEEKRTEGRGRNSRKGILGHSQVLSPSVTHAIVHGSSVRWRMKERWKERKSGVDWRETGQERRRRGIINQPALCAAGGEKGGKRGSAEGVRRTGEVDEDKFFSDPQLM